MFEAGTGFWINPDTHLWFILSDPEISSVEVLYVNITTFDPSSNPKDAFNDRACLIESGEHGFVTRTSCVCYYGAHVCASWWLDQKLANHEIRLHPEPASGALLDKMRQCAGDSRHMEPDCYDVLVRQGLVS
jgi:hypothetical protein